MEDGLITLLVGLTLSVPFVVLLLNKKETMENSNLLTLGSLGLVTRPSGKTYDLTDYYIDVDNNLYSRNLSTWEINPKKGKDLLICSDGTRDKSGYLINTLRDRKGNKVTLRRKDLNFYTSSKITVKVERNGTRHLDVLDNEKFVNERYTLRNELLGGLNA